jgi:hypothetical protein
MQPQPSPWGQPSPGPKGTKSRLPWILGAIAVAVVMIIVIVVAAVDSSPSSTNAGATVGPTTTTVPLGPVTASTVLTANRGTVVFSDNFHDPFSGWGTTPTANDRLTFGTGGFVFSATGNYLHQDWAPYTVPVAQVGLSTTASQAADAPTGDGFGVICTRGLGVTSIRYEFILKNSSTWVIYRHDGVVTNLPMFLKEGTAPAVAGTTPATVTGMCATQNDGTTTRLVMFINGSMVTDITDSTTLPDNGWTSGIVVETKPGPGSTVTFANFTERDLDH